MAGPLQAHGLGIALPQGWEGQIRRRPSPGVTAAQASGMVNQAVLHAANFPLPPERGDFGSGAVDIMGADHALVVLIEYERESAKTALFARPGPPPSLSPQSFRPETLQRTIPGQAGAQTFFNAKDRALCLYVVLGHFRNLTRLLPMVNTVVGTIRIDAP